MRITGDTYAYHLVILSASLVGEKVLLGGLVEDKRFVVAKLAEHSSHTLLHDWSDVVVAALVAEVGGSAAEDIKEACSYLRRLVWLYDLERRAHASRYGHGFVGRIEAAIVAVALACSG